MKNRYGTVCGLTMVALGMLVTTGCNTSSAGGKAISKDQEKLMRQPPGTVPMPKEAADAMRKAQQPPPAGKPVQ